MMAEPNAPENPRTANEHAHAFGESAEGLDGVENASVKRGSFTDASRVRVSVDLEMDPEELGELATDHGVTNVEQDSYLETVTFTFKHSGETGDF